MFLILIPSMIYLQNCKNLITMEQQLQLQWGRPTVENLLSETLDTGSETAVVYQYKHNVHAVFKLRNLLARNFKYKSMSIPRKNL